ncbi:hypothetical protein F511_38554 [Dorcoceras hygrometricum]|uniref:Uncharacterized protein n=1 Tax=Dorcoceras hygrometricum TaxID=472368 RepID=A0A2Z7DDT4_9LAMI|nr:hypothetical protein F511_38554 [Dorcoceras hygrometricum]
MKRRRVEISADGLVLMTSSVTSSYSADGLKDQSQESAGNMHPDARGSDVVEEIFSRKLLFTSRCYLEIAIAKRDDVIIFSRWFERAVARIQQVAASRRKRKRRRRGDIQSQATVHQQMLFGDSDSKTMSFT